MVFYFFTSRSCQYKQCKTPLWRELTFIRLLSHYKFLHNGIWHFWTNRFFQLLCTGQQLIGIPICTSFMYRTLHQAFVIVFVGWFLEGCVQCWLSAQMGFVLCLNNKWVKTSLSSFKQVSLLFHLFWRLFVLTPASV